MPNWKRKRQIGPGPTCARVPVGLFSPFEDRIRFARHSKMQILIDIFLGCSILVASKGLQEDIPVVPHSALSPVVWLGVFMFLKLGISHEREQTMSPKKSSSGKAEPTASPKKGKIKVTRTSKSIH